MVSIVFINGIRNEYLYGLARATRDSLAASEGEFEVISIDNDSVVGGGFLASTSDIYVKNKENRGFTIAANQGIKLSSAPYICIANNDIKVSPNWIKVTEELFEKYPKAATVHFKMVGYDDPFNLGVDEWETGKERWCHGSFFVIRRKVIEELGPYDESYGMGGFDDWDMQHRYRHLGGWSTVYTNRAAFQHADSSTYNTEDQIKRAERDHHNREHFKKKFGEYPEDIWSRLYPDQMKTSWRPFP